MTAESERRIEAFEIKSFRKLLGVTYRDRKTNAEIRQTVQNYVGSQEPLLATVKRRKLSWYAHLTRHDSLAKTILQGTVQGGRRRGRQRKSWLDNVKSWTDLTTPELLAASADRPTWRQTSASASLRSPRRRPRHGSDLT